jgi:hypothetical protein
LQVTAFAVRVEELLDDGDHCALGAIMAHGFLCSVESLLSTHGSEIKMTRDMEGALEVIQKSFRLTLKPKSAVPTGGAASTAMGPAAADGGASDDGPHGAGAPTNANVQIRRFPDKSGFYIDLLLPTLVWGRLPAVARGGGAIEIVPALFSQGVNEWQSLSNLVGTNKLQQQLNRTSLRVLKKHAKKVIAHYDTNHSSFLTAEPLRSPPTAASDNVRIRTYHPPPVTRCQSPAVSTCHPLSQPVSPAVSTCLHMLSPPATATSHPAPLTYVRLDKCFYFFGGVFDVLDFEWWLRVIFYTRTPAW